jgi:hypothetical protein
MFVFAAVVAVAVDGSNAGQFGLTNAKEEGGAKNITRKMLAIAVAPVLRDHSIA